MAKTTKKPGSKSAAIRDVLGKQPNANVKAIQEALGAKGIKASDALINKIKYGYGTNGKKTVTKRRRRKSNKAEAIRAAWRELGTSARPRDVIALLATRGVKVTSAQVSTLRKSVKQVRKVQPKAPAATVPYDHLVEAKALATRLGSIERAQRALASLSDLLRN